jgi:hypothetical protein
MVQLRQTEGIRCRNKVNRNTESNGFNLADKRLRMPVQVRFGQDDDGIQATVVGKGQEPFNATQVEITVQAANDKHRIEVGCNHLFACWQCVLLSMRACGTPGQRVFSWQNTINHRIGNQHPIPCDGIQAIDLMVKPSGCRGRPFSFSLADIKAVFSHTDHSGRYKCTIVQVVQMRLKRRGPSHL